MSLIDIFKTPSTARSVEQASVPLEFCSLIERMNRVASSAKVDLTKNIFHLMEQDSHRHKFQEDPLTKLKNIENRSEINRACVELVAQRRPKRYSSNSHKPVDSNSKESYLSIYRQFQLQRQHRIFNNHGENQFTSEDELVQTNEEGPSGIKHYQFLKEHPKILNFALEKLRDKNSKEKVKERKEQQLIELRAGSRLNKLQLGNQFQDLLESTRKAQPEAMESPKDLVDNQLTKFYSKSSKGKIDAKIKGNARCNSFLMRQQRILCAAEDRRVSKENLKKLKQRLNQIVNEMHRQDKRSKQFLPKIMSASNTDI